MEHSFDQGVGAEIKRLREEREWSMAKLAVEADMSVSGVSMIENGKRNLTTTTLAKLARAFGVEVRDLFPLGQAPLLEEQDERREAIYRSWRDYITLRARSVADQAESKDYYAPAWILEVDKIPREITQTLFDYGVLGKRETFPTEAERRQSWEIADALTELNQAVDQAWRAQMREAERLERQREAAAELDSIWKKRKKADESSEEALEAIRQERSAGA